MKQCVARDNSVVMPSKNPQFYVSDAIEFVALGKDSIRRNDFARAQKWYKMALQAFKNANAIADGKWAVEQDQVKAEYATIVLSRRRVA